MNNIILFATYWNEIEWIEASLDQIDRIDPIEVIICDGCFDERYPLHSTDGTREVIEKWVQNRNYSRLISPVRYPKFKAIWKILQGHEKLKWHSCLNLSRWYTILLSMRLVPYRINQSLTFNHMISLSERWEPGRWFMTYDCDQFYSDEMIEKFAITNGMTNYGLLEGREKTFFKDFQSYTLEYDTRTYNNMPHKIYSGTLFVPTRNPIIEKMFLRKRYYNALKTIDVGCFYHYKLKSPKRFAETYLVGDRKAPVIDRYSFRKMKEPHPSIIQKYFEIHPTNDDKKV